MPSTPGAIPRVRGPFAALAVMVAMPVLIVVVVIGLLAAFFQFMGGTEVPHLPAEAPPRQTPVPTPK